MARGRVRRRAAAAPGPAPQSAEGQQGRDLGRDAARLEQRLVDAGHPRVMAAGLAVREMLAEPAALLDAQSLRRSAAPESITVWTCSQRRPLASSSYSSLSLRRARNRPLSTIWRDMPSWCRSRRRSGPRARASRAAGGGSPTGRGRLRGDRSRGCLLSIAAGGRGHERQRGRGVHAGSRRRSRAATSRRAAARRNSSMQAFLAISKIHGLKAISCSLPRSWRRADMKTSWAMSSARP